MKQLKSSGKYQVRKAEAITTRQEDHLWQKGLLGDKHPQQLLDTLVFLYWSLLCVAKSIEGCDFISHKYNNVSQ